MPAGQLGLEIRAGGQLGAGLLARGNFGSLQILER